MVINVLSKSLAFRSQLFLGKLLLENFLTCVTDIEVFYMLRMMISDLFLEFKCELLILPQL